MKITSNYVLSVVVLPFGGHSCGIVVVHRGNHYRIGRPEVLYSGHQKSYCHLYKTSELRPINGVTLGEYVAKSHAIRTCQGME